MDPLGRFLKMALQDWIRDGGGSGPETILFVENGIDTIIFFWKDWLDTQTDKVTVILSFSSSLLPTSFSATILWGPFAYLDYIYTHTVCISIYLNVPKKDVLLGLKFSQ